MANSITKYTSLEGLASIGENKHIFFASDQAAPDTIDKFRIRGIVQTMSDGSFEFVPTPRQRSMSVLVKKVPHGRLSYTKDGAYLLWLKVFDNEVFDVAKTICEEANDATSVLNLDK